MEAVPVRGQGSLDGGGLEAEQVTFNCCGYIQVRAPKDHRSMRIPHSGPKGQDQGDSRNSAS